MNTPARLLTAAGAAALLLQPTMAAAQQAPACVTEQEVSAIAIYSVPSIVQAVKQRCGNELSTSGYLARRSNALTARYTALQPTVWPRARTGLFKLFAGKASGGSEGLDAIATLPDDAVRPLVDALIVQEAAPKVAVKNCSRIERVIEVMAPIDPEVAGTLIGLLVGFADSDKLPVCPARRA